MGPLHHPERRLSAPDAVILSVGLCSDINSAPAPAAAPCCLSQGQRSLAAVHCTWLVFGILWYRTVTVRMYSALYGYRSGNMAETWWRIAANACTGGGCGTSCVSRDSRGVVSLKS